MKSMLVSPSGTIDWHRHGNKRPTWGLFEHCEIMLEDQILDWRTFYHIYRHRVAYA